MRFKIIPVSSGGILEVGHEPQGGVEITVHQTLAPGEVGALLVADNTPLLLPSIGNTRGDVLPRCTFK